MKTIKSGKIFCKLYNEKNGTNFTPKEIFCNVIAPLLFYSKDFRFLINWTNSKFFYIERNYNKKIKENKDANLNIVLNELFEKALNEFCADLESDEHNLMTTKQVYGGHAIPEKDSKGFLPSTYFSYSDNLYYTIDERYCSFIGSMFQLCVGKFYLIIDNPQVIWYLFEGANEYRKYVDNNKSFKGCQLPTWNSMYLYSLATKNNFQSLIDKCKDSKKDKGLYQFGTKIKFENILYSLCKLKVNIKYINIVSFGQTNITTGYVLINLPYVKHELDLYKAIYDEIEDKKDFDFFEFNKVFGSGNLIDKAIKIGAIYNNFFDPIEDIDEGKYKDKEEEYKQYIKNKVKYLNLIMKQETKELANDFVKKIIEIKGKNKTSLREEYKNLLSSYNEAQFLKNLNIFIENSHSDEIFKVVVDYITSISQDEVKMFILYSKFISIA